MRAIEAGTAHLRPCDLEEVIFPGAMLPCNTLGGPHARAMTVWLGFDSGE
jgi:hypothetical protein